MSDNDTTNTLKNPHPAVSFAQVGDDIISVITQLAEIFKNNFQKVNAPELSNAPIKSIENRRPEVLEQLILTSPMQKKIRQDHKQQLTQNEQPTHHYFER
jgi:flagellar biosynthesis/type III secretory pathway chaperone